MTESNITNQIRYTQELIDANRKRSRELENREDEFQYQMKKNNEAVDFIFSQWNDVEMHRKIELCKEDLQQQMKLQSNRFREEKEELEREKCTLSNQEDELYHEQQRLLMDKENI
jgi:hypothetical protein